MMRSVSDPSIGTATGTVGTAFTGRASHLNIKNKRIKYRGKWLWEGRFGFTIQKSVLAPWNIWWQISMVLIITYKYIVHLLPAFYLESTNAFLTATFIFGEVLFFCDVIIHLMHEFCPILRLHMRVYKRNYLLLAYDVISLTPLNIIYKYRHRQDTAILIGRWLVMGRIYKTAGFFKTINETMRTSRRKLYLGQHIVTLLLGLHACIIFHFNLIYFKKTKASDD